MKFIYTNYFKLANSLNHRYANQFTLKFLFFVFKEKKGCFYYNLNLELMFSSYWNLAEGELWRNLKKESNKISSYSPILPSEITISTGPLKPFQRCIIILIKIRLYFECCFNLIFQQFHIRFTHLSELWFQIFTCQTDPPGYFNQLKSGLNPDPPPGSPPTLPTLGNNPTFKFTY